MIESLIYSLIIGIGVGISAGYLGSLMVLKKMALVGDALSHVALPGLALGILFNFNPFIGAFIFLFASAIVVWHLGRVTKISFEAIVGAMFTLALAIGIIMISDLDALEAALFGDISTVSLIGTVTTIVISIASVLLTRVIYKKLVLGMISEDLAISKGINVAGTNLLYLLLVSLTVAMGIQIVGTLLVGFLVIVPAIAARNVSAALSRYAALSAIFGAISSLAGLTIAYNFNQRPGPFVVFSGIAVFIITVIVKWRTK